MLCYFDKENKPVIFQSTEKKIMDFDKVNNRFFIQERYNKGMGGVDLVDRFIRENSCKRATLRWPLIVFYNIVDICCYNAFKICSSKFETYKNFLIKLSCQLCYKYQLKRATKKPILFDKLIKLNILSIEDYTKLFTHNSLSENKVEVFQPKVLVNKYFDPNNQYQKSKSAHIFYQTKKTDCIVCLHHNFIDPKRTSNGCSICHCPSCPEHTGLICLDCLNYFIYLRSNEKSEEK